MKHKNNNNTVILFIVFSVFLFFLFLFFTHYNLFYLKEGFSNKTENILLVGDSILNNNKYVSKTSSIEYLLKQKAGNVNVVTYAKDGATINDVYPQIDSIKESENSVIFVSAGGNDILSSSSPDIDVNSLFQSYKKMIDSLKIRMDKSKIVLLDIYYPKDETMMKYKSVLEKWNELIDDYANTQGYEVIKTSKLLTGSTDFVNCVEPSETGGSKIVSQIISKIN